MGTFRRTRLAPGIYDEVITSAVDAQLQRLDASAFAIERKQIEKSADVTPPIAALLRDALDLTLDELGGESAKTINLAEDILATLARHAPRAFKDGEVQLRPERLLGIVPKPAALPSFPRGSLHTSNLIVNAEGESLLDHLRSEFESADSVDLLCAFVKLSGFEKLRSAIERHCISRGRLLRVLTTTYMGASDARAVERFAALPNSEIRVSYDDQTTRLHAKAWVFHRESGLSTAYVGSSNLSHAAQTDGLEWNVRVTKSDQPALLAQMAETFEQYWADQALFEPFDAQKETHRKRLARSLAAADRDPGLDALIELEPKAFQKPVLEDLSAARALGRRRNLLVAATGTGKTVMAALDYAALRQAGRVDTLLFVAHRREILEQARTLYRAALQSSEFGELLYQGQEPTIGHHVFASIDSLRDDRLDPKRFDMIVIDEAHHSPAFKWESFLAKVGERTEILGLTGTPERADGVDYDHLFPRPWIGNLRIWNAIPQALVPFRYYMLDVEGVDLRDVGWVSGRYASDELAGKLIGAADLFVHRAVKAVAEHIARPEQLRAIAFCASIRHAEIVAEQLARRGFRTQVLTGETAATERRQARSDLNLGKIQVLCVVDIYNEGVDVPNVNTLFFFRPTESSTVFLQQLGRGLRLARNKSELVVFDLTGRQHDGFRFDQRFRRMLGKTPRELREGFERGFAKLPAGCHLQLDEVAREHVLAQLERSIPDTLPELRAMLREPAHAALSLDEFIVETEIGLDVIYRNKRSWTELRRSVGLESRALAPEEEEALENVCKLTHVGDALRLETWKKLVQLDRPWSALERRVENMLFAVLYGRERAGRYDEAWDTWSHHPLLRAEIAALIPVLARENAVLARDRRLEAANPLVLHARYLGVELSAAFGQRTKDGEFRDFYTGVEAVADGRYDMLLVTLEKSAAQKEHLRYRDFPLSERRFHWQSKAGTTQDSKQGRRHIDHEREKCQPLLFVRERADARPGVTMAFRYLGPVRPVRVEGERPITIEWELLDSMPPELLRVGRIAS
jgi:superfamily II DNA or RNA helicase/HKD family nuclease